MDQNSQIKNLIEEVNCLKLMTVGGAQPVVNTSSKFSQLNSKDKRGGKPEDGKKSVQNFEMTSNFSVVTNSAADESLRPQMAGSNSNSGVKPNKTRKAAHLAQKAGYSKPPPVSPSQGKDDQQSDILILNETASDQTAKMAAATEALDTNACDIQKNEESGGGASWRLVENRRRGRQGRLANAVIGELSTGLGNLRVVPRKSYLHVTRLHPDTTTADVVEFLDGKIMDISCEQIKSKFPEHYSSFKVTINSDDRERAMDPKLWPKGAFVTRFFLRARKRETVK